MQKGRAGLRPVTTKIIKMPNGDACVGREEVFQCWQHHFHGVLNMRSSFLADAVDEALNHPVDDSLDDPPSEDEVLEALMKMKCGKAGEKNGVLPELLKCCSGSLLDQLVELFQMVWKEGSVP